MKSSVIIIIIALLSSSVADTKSDGKYDYNFPAPLQRVVMQVNNINTNFWNNGIFNKYETTGGGLIWPASSAPSYVIDVSTGIWIGAKVGPQRELRLAACFYNSHFSPGNIPVIGKVPPQSVCNDPAWKPYLVNLVDPQLVNGGTRIKVAGGITFTIIYDSWANWPVTRGAPYVEVNNIPGYQPGWNSDRPGIWHTTARPDEISFMVYMDYTNCTNNIHASQIGLPGGTLPLGVEIQQISFAFLAPGLVDVYFVKWRIINKSSLAWDSTYVSIVDDANIGNPNDDLAGCDSAKQVGIMYNADNNDPIYGNSPPALGIRLLECPLNYTGNNSDTAHLPYGNFPKYRLLKMSGYYVFDSTNDTCKKDPNNAISGYNFMRGKDGCGNTMINPITGNPTTFKNNFILCPPPGWMDTIRGDKKQMLSTGPFTLNPGNDRMLVAVVIAARSSSNYNSACVILENSQAIYSYYMQSFGGNPIGIMPISNEVPDRFMLYQNYPNPFNPVTKIKFALPPSPKGEGSGVRVVIYDILGSEIATLVNEQLQPGTYEVEWPAPSGDAANYPSGVYFYKISTKDFTATKKMVLMK